MDLVRKWGGWIVTALGAAYKALDAWGNFDFLGQEKPWRWIDDGSPYFPYALIGGGLVWIFWESNAFTKLRERFRSIKDGSHQKQKLDLLAIIEDEKWEYRNQDPLMFSARVKIRNQSAVPARVKSIWLEPTWLKSAEGGVQLEVEPNEFTLPFDIAPFQTEESPVTFRIDLSRIGGGASRFVRHRDYRIGITDVAGNKYHFQRRMRRVWHG